MTENRLPNFLIVGAAKAATTSIHEYLKQHPEIHMTSIKEPCFFTFYEEQPPFYSTGRSVKFIHKQNEYENLFAGSEFIKVRGESSTPYLFFHKKTINNIKRLIPDFRKLRILIVLRNPVDRAYSQYTMKVRDVVENLSFEEAIMLEEERINSNAHFDFFYLKRGLYYEQVMDYVENFDNVKIMFYDDFKTDKSRFLSEILRFLELYQIDFYPINKENVSGIPRLKWLNSLVLSRSKVKTAFSGILSNRIKNKFKINIAKINNVSPPKMSPETRKILIEFYREDVKKLEKLLNKNLSSWYE